MNCGACRRHGDLHNSEETNLPRVAPYKAIAHVKSLCHIYRSCLMSAPLQPVPPFLLNCLQSSPGSKDWLEEKNALLWITYTLAFVQPLPGAHLSSRGCLSWLHVFTQKNHSVWLSHPNNFSAYSLRTEEPDQIRMALCSYNVQYDASGKPCVQ